MRNDRFQSRERGNVAYYHLPGLFEFYELYRLFLPLFYTHREYFYDWCEIGSIYGAPEDCLWGGGRVEAGEAEPEEVLALMQKYGISARLTFSNSLLRKEHLADQRCNMLCQLFEKSTGVKNGMIVHSELLVDYLKKKYPGGLSGLIYHESVDRISGVSAGNPERRFSICRAGFPSE